MDNKKRNIGWKLCMLLLTAALLVGTVSPRVAGAASTPAKPSFSVSKRTKTTVTIKIKKSGKVTGYHVYVKKGKKGKYSLWTFSFSRTFKLKKLKANQTYYVKIRAYRTQGLSIKKGKFSAAKKISVYKKPAAKPQATKNPSQDSSTEYANKVLELVNEERSKAGLDDLTLDETLNKAATVRAEEITREFSHSRPDGSDAFTVLKECGYNTYTATGENIAAGQATPEEVVESWMNSEGHRANILSDKFKKLGVGYYKVDDGYQHYWVQLFSD